MPSIYIINPASTCGYHSSEFFSESSADAWVQVADLSTVTVAAFVPEGWDIRITDEALSPVDFDAEVDFVALTGKVSQRQRLFELAREFRRRGRTVIIGGSYASLTVDEVRPHADILVTGELEDIAPRLFGDLESGRWDDLYEGGQADLRNARIPRWDLYPVNRAISGALQTARGCPFNCEFCDVIQYQGRKQRFKSVEQVLAELDALYAHGFRKVFLVDDNFTVSRRRAHAILDGLIAWNAEHADDPVSFMTQASLDAARDPDLLEKCHAAGLRTFFMGVETVNEDSLKETGKKQNLLLPMREALSIVVRSGIAVKAGIILGFDHDTRDVFSTMERFFDESPLPDLSIGVLTAPRSTDLYSRMEREGRLIDDVWEASAVNPFTTNILPKQMTRDELLDGTLALCRKAYSAEAFGKRMLRMIEEMPATGAPPRVVMSQQGADRRKLTMRCLTRIAAMGEAEARMVGAVLRAANAKPAILPIVLNILGRFGQARHLLDSQSRESAQPAVAA